MQYVGKVETELSLRINNHRKDVLKSNAIPADRHFAQRDHDFNSDALNCLQDFTIYVYT